MIVRLRSERIITADGVLAGEVAVEEGRIASVAPSRGGAELDLGGRWLVPGYIDLHVHGGGGGQFNTSDPDEIRTVAAFHAAHGTTALLATTVAAPLPELETALRAIGRCAGHDGGAEVLGAHLEGPFVSRERPGAMDPETFRDPDEDALMRLLAAAGGHMRMMTLAPELPGAVWLTTALAEVGCVASLGHSDATYDEALRAVRAGATSATHLFNAMRPLRHRDPGVLGAALDVPELNCELIADGIHVDPPALRLAHRAKGPDGIRLVTDAMQAAGMPDGDYRLGAATVTVSDGRAVLAGGGSIAGSTLTMDVAVRNAVEFLRIGFEEAVRLASRNPARVVGLADRKGAIAPGLDADLVVLDDDLRVMATMVAGRWVHGPE